MKKKIFLALALIILCVLLIPQHVTMPVADADDKSYNHESFWYYPWGKSGTHKGVDIFAKEGTDVHAATSGFVLYAGNVERGGNIVMVLGPKWRVHYYAHLKKIDTSFLAWVNAKTKIGEVGTTGNAAGKAAHLHYSISTLIPYPWRVDSSEQGWKKMFYLNPIDYLQASAKQ